MQSLIKQRQEKELHCWLVLVVVCSGFVSVYADVVDVDFVKASFESLVKGVFN